MKKVLLSIIALIFLVSFFTACNTNSDVRGILNNNKEETFSKEITKKISGGEFSGGLAWIRVDGITAHYCINTKGEVLFFTEGIPSDSGQLIADPKSAFYNGVAVLEDDTIIDKDGNILASPYESGFDSTLISNNYNYFINDMGYVWVEKSIDTFEKTETQYGVINNKGEWHLNLSADYSFIDDPLTEYLGGNLYKYMDSSVKDTESNRNMYVIFDLSKKKEIYRDFELEGIYDHVSDTLLVKNAREDWIKKINSNRKVEELTNIKTDGVISSFSDGLFFIESEGNFYDLNGNAVLNISKYHMNNTINMPHFVDGYCLLDIKNEEDSEFYTIIDKKGNRMFEPRKAEKHGVLSDGLLRIEDDGSYINVKGEVVISNCYDGTDFKNGVARIGDIDVKYIDKKGNPIKIFETEKTHMLLSDNILQASSSKDNDSKSIQPEDSTVNDLKKIHVKLIDGQSWTPYLYCWVNKEDELLGAWAGTKMHDNDGDGWYDIEFTTTDKTYNFIISNGSSDNQTDNLMGTSPELWVQMNVELPDHGLNDVSVYNTKPE
ncbi:hypothetical protein AGMMS50284_4880 [Clostridia bacterium]|nr:hypothetical protein AGMMS50284_4880 [Clostridia bacterium]